MLGRGIIRNPELAERIFAGDTIPDVFDKKRFRAFHDELIEEYKEYMYGEKPVLYKMKELWFYMMSRFPDCGNLEKKIKKTNRLDEYRSYMDELFS